MPAPFAPAVADLGTGVGAVFTDRRGGVSQPPYDGLNLAYHVGDDWAAARANRDIVARSIGAELGRCCFVHQVHGPTVCTVRTDQVGTVATRSGRRDGDAMVTTAVVAPLVILVADCVPVLLADAVHRVVGAAHAGRHGILTGVVPATVAAMVAAGAQIDAIQASLGPSVCALDYEVPAALAAEAESVVPGAAATSRRGTPAIDLAGAVASQLEAAGICSVVRDPRCTVESGELFSYRRDGVTGRFAGLVWLVP